MIKESCVETVKEAIIAANAGADQLELCADLASDGLTPSEKTILEVLEKVKIPVKVMIRSRGGDFQYSKTEIKEMTDHVIRLKKLPISGFVFGATIKDEVKQIHLDMISIKIIAAAAMPLPVTIHKAIDLCTDPLSEIPALKTIPNVTTILSSGGKDTAIDGLKTLTAMHQIALPEINIIAAGKITYQNLKHLHQKLNFAYYHGKKIVKSEAFDKNI